MNKVSIALQFYVGDQVSHEKYGCGVVVGYWAEEVARGSDHVRRSMQSVSYTVAFEDEQRTCLPQE